MGYILCFRGKVFMKIKKMKAYKTDDGFFYKDKFMGYVFLPQTSVDVIDKSIDVILNEINLQKAKEAFISTVLSLMKPFIFENHRGIQERSIKITSQDNECIDLGYPIPIFVSINDPSGETINIAPSRFFEHVKDCVNIVLTLNKTAHILFFGDSKDDTNNVDKFNRFCSKLAGDITENIIKTVFSISKIEDTFKQTFEAVYDNFSWHKGDFSESFNGSIKIEFINFRNFNKDFDESKACRFFSINDDKKYLLMGCAIKVYLGKIIYINKIKN